jgi:hypothetical protein
MKASDGLLNGEQLASASELAEDLDEHPSSIFD